MADAPILGGTKKHKLDDEVFGVPFNGPLVHEVVVAELAARRRGTHATKTRGMVRGGGAKPWRQKGTGRARAGSSRSPIWTGGGTVFGPQPRHYTVKVNRKARRAALRCALSVHAERSSIFAFDLADFEAPSTKQAAELIADRRGGSVLVVLGAEESAAAKSFRNLAGVSVIPTEACGVADLVGHATLLVSEVALNTLTERAKKPVVAHRPRGGERLMDASQVIIRPVVSEKSYVLATADKYTFRVHPDAHKTQIKQAVEQLFDVTVLEVRTSKVPSKPKRRGYTSGRTPRLEEGDRAGARGRLHPDLPGPRGRSLDADPQAQAHLSRPPVRLLRRLRRDHEDRAGEVPRRGPHEVRRAQRQRAQDRPPPRWRRQAPVPADRLQAHRTTSRRRSPRSSTTPTGRPTSRCCTTSTATRPTSSPRTACASA